MRGAPLLFPSPLWLRSRFKKVKSPAPAPLRIANRVPGPMPCLVLFIRHSEHLTRRSLGDNSRPPLGVLCPARNRFDRLERFRKTTGGSELSGTFSPRPVLVELSGAGLDASKKTYKSSISAISGRFDMKSSSVRHIAVTNLVRNGLCEDISSRVYRTS